MKNFGTVPRRALDAKTISPNKRLGNKNVRKITREFLSQVTFFVSIIVNPASPSLPCRGERLASAKKNLRRNVVEIAASVGAVNQPSNKAHLEYDFAVRCVFRRGAEQRLGAILAFKDVYYKETT